MARQRDREAFVGVVVAEGGTVSLARALMSAGRTLHRLAEAQCNGDWPADNGERKVEPCGKCGASWDPSVLQRPAGQRGSSLLRRKRELEAQPYGDQSEAYADVLERIAALPGKTCPDCRTEAKVHALLKPTGMRATCQGDPRGAVIRLHVPSGRDEGWGGVAVP